MIYLSIIVPVYNVEKYIRPCIESIFNQGLDDNCFEVIIVNDGTKDKSMEMITDIVKQHNNITIINQENQGLSVARNNGIAKAKGEYILMIDSDDLLFNNIIARLLPLTNETKVDLLVADYLKMNDEEINRYNYSPQLDFKIKEKNGNELFIEDFNPHESYVWHILYRRLFLIENHITFIPNIFYQDVPFNNECHLKADKCIKVSCLLNIYRTGRLEAATQSFNKKKALDYCIVIKNTWKLKSLAKRNVLKKLQDNIYTSFRSLVYFTSHDIKDPIERKQIIDYLKQIVPDLYFNNGIRQICISYMYRVMPHTLINLRRIYGTVFEDIVNPFLHKIRQHFLRTNR